MEGQVPAPPPHLQALGTAGAVPVLKAGCCQLPKLLLKFPPSHVCWAALLFQGKRAFFPFPVLPLPQSLILGCPQLWGQQRDLAVCAALPRSLSRGENLP